MNRTEYMLMFMFALDSARSSESAAVSIAQTAAAALFWLIWVFKLSRSEP